MNIKIASALKSKIGTVNSNVNGIQADLDNDTDGLGALKALIEGQSDSGKSYHYNYSGAYTTHYTGYIKKMETVVQVPLEKPRFIAHIKGQGGSMIGYGQFYVNGSAVGSVFSSAGHAYYGYTSTVDLNVGDLVQLYVKATEGGVMWYYYLAILSKYSIPKELSIGVSQNP